ncbi:MAG: bacteriorhodopsin-like [Bacteroidota bacterium]
MDLFFDFSVTGLLAEVTNTLNPSDAVGFTFFVGYMSMFAASVFFFFEMSTVTAKWRTSLLVSGLITMIAAVHYYYMRDYYLTTGDNPTVYRYIDWTLTVPLMCVEFFLILRPAGAKQSMMWRFIAASVLMLVAGYIGEAFYADNGTMNIIWGFISTLGWAWIIYEVWAGSAKQLAAKTDSDAVKKGFRNLTLFATIGWGIYPIGYMMLPGNFLSSFADPSSMDLVYNIGDAINKIGFGLVVYATAKAETARLKATA